MKAMRITALSLMVLFLASLSFAAQGDVNPNGFPSGPHYNLNIIGKKADFTCPLGEYGADGNPIYGNTVFVRENGPGQIYMQSGKGSRAAAVTELQAIDPCTFDDNKAVIQLPKNDNGYRVYARALAKPGSASPPSMSILPGMDLVQDEIGEDLVYIGLITPTELTTPWIVSRTKGQQKATNITDLFKWTGYVCYFSTVPSWATASPTSICCQDSNGDGVFTGSECILPVAGVCDTGYALSTAHCASYSYEWVFNIADFVQYFWGVNNSGVKLLQVRFYPN